MPGAAPVIADVEAARTRIAGHAWLTPLLENDRLNALAGRRVLIKAECLQRTGSFKFRGAFNAIQRIDRAAFPGGVVAFSSGNHAQGVAAAAALGRLPALIVMPADTPGIKIANTRGYGAEIVTYDRATENRETIARRLAEERRAAVIPPYDHPDVIAGQGTAGLEILAQAPCPLEHLIVPASGGGLMAGIALAFSHQSPGTRLMTAEPEGFDDHARSFASGTRQRNTRNTGSISDALMAEMPGALTFAINQPRVAGGLAVSEAETRAAVRTGFAVLKLVIEPGGAVGLAALLAGKLPGSGPVGILASGGNVDPTLFAAIITG